MSRIYGHLSFPITLVSVFQPNNMTKLAFQAPSSASSKACIDPVYTGVLADSSFTEDDCSPHWEDTFFDDEEDVIEVFDFDYPLMEEFTLKLGFAKLMVMFLFFEFYFLSIGFKILMELKQESIDLCFTIPQFMFCSTFIIAVVTFLPHCFFRRNVRWNVYSQHLCVTRVGVRWVQEKRKSCFGWACTDKGRRSVTVPFDKITDCDIYEPAGNTFCCVKNVLFIVNVAGGRRNAKGIAVPELAIKGLKNPYRFKNLVWEMKRSTAANAAVHQVNAPTSQITQSNDVSQLLTEICHVLQEQTKMLQRNASKEVEMV